MIYLASGLLLAIVSLVVFMLHFTISSNKEIITGTDINRKGED